MPRLAERELRLDVIAANGFREDREGDATDEDDARIDDVGRSLGRDEKLDGEEAGDDDGEELDQPHGQDDGIERDAGTPGNRLGRDRLVDDLVHSPALPVVAPGRQPIRVPAPDLSAFVGLNSMFCYRSR